MDWPASTSSANTGGRREVLIARGRTAPLSSNEEVFSDASRSVFPSRQIFRRETIAHLFALSLIEKHGAGLRLTPLGRERYLSLPNSGDIYDSDRSDVFVSKMAEFMSQARGLADTGISGRTLSRLPLSRAELRYSTGKTIDLQDFRTGHRDRGPA